MCMALCARSLLAQTRKWTCHKLLGDTTALRELVVVATALYLVAAFVTALLVFLTLSEDTVLSKMLPVCRADSVLASDWLVAALLAVGKPTLLRLRDRTFDRDNPRDRFATVCMITLLGEVLYALLMWVPASRDGDLLARIYYCLSMNCVLRGGLACVVVSQGPYGIVHGKCREAAHTGPLPDVP